MSMNDYQKEIRRMLKGNPRLVRLVYHFLLGLRGGAAA